MPCDSFSFPKICIKILSTNCIEILSLNQKHMKNFFFLSLIFLFSCHQNKQTVMEKNVEQLLETDRQFSEMSIKKGYPDAFIAYAAQEVILMNENSYPVIGKQDLTNHFNQKKGTKTILTWQPTKGEISKSNDLGYTFGNWKLTAKDSTGKELIYEGNYATIWKKQTDGTWKYVLDCGSSNPEKKNN